MKVMNFFRAVRTPPWSYLAVFVGIGIILGLTSWLPYLAARQLVRHELKAFQAAQQSVAFAALQLGTSSPYARLSLGEIGPSKALADHLQAITKDVHTAALPQPANIIPGLTIPGTPAGKFIRAVNLTNHDLAASRTATAPQTAAAQHFFEHQTAVAQALTNILTYNAATDFAAFDPASSDTKKRLELARTGLITTKSRLEAAHDPSDPTLSAAIADIARLQTARDQLAADGSLDSWKSQVIATQSLIVTNRRAAWDQTTSKLSSDLATLGSQLSTGRDRWTVLLTY